MRRTVIPCLRKTNGTSTAAGIRVSGMSIFGFRLWSPLSECLCDFRPLSFSVI